MRGCGGEAFGGVLTAGVLGRSVGVLGPFFGVNYC